MESSWFKARKGVWLFYCDGGARGNPGPAAAGFIGFDEKGKVVCEERFGLGRTTNNEAEYRALLGCLSWIINEGGGRDVLIFSDSQLLVNQMKGVYKVKNRGLQMLVMEAKQKENEYKGKIFYVLIPREANYWADKLVNDELGDV